MSLLTQCHSPPLFRKRGKFREKMASGAGLLGNQRPSLQVMTGAGGGGSARTTTAGKDNASSTGGGFQAHPLPPPAAAVREQDRFMPIANVIRIMRRVLPAHAKIADDAKEMIQECVSEYISFITSEANERCQREQRKTVTADDVLWAMRKLGFDDYLDPLTLFLHRYRELEAGVAADQSACHNAPPTLHLPMHHRNTTAPVPDISGPASQYFAAPPLPGFLMPPAQAQAQAQPNNLMSESMVGYFLNMYGGGGRVEAGPSGAAGYNIPNLDRQFHHK